VARVAFSSEQTALAWEFARAHLPELLARYPFFGRNQYLPQIANAFTDAARADELLAVVRSRLPADALTEAERSADLIRHNAAVKQRELPKIDAWVKTRLQPVPES
jgi:hypothetical protein